MGVVFAPGAKGYPVPFRIDDPATVALREKVALGCRILAKLELVDYLGHVSARIPGEPLAFIRARGAEQGNQLHMTAEQVTLVDLEAVSVAGRYPPPDETKLHTEIYKARPDVMAIVHTHQPVSTVFGDVEKPILPMRGIEATVVEQGEIPIYRSARKITTTQQGAELARVLGDKHVVHLQNHGIAIVGTSVEEVVIDAIWLEHEAKMTMSALAIGAPRGMARAELLVQKAEAFGLENRWRYYASLLDD
jgi:ribulose-5-phosphate 4-epimerase/fuculose-1-phosphate aldolase